MPSEKLGEVVFNFPIPMVCPLGKICDQLSSPFTLVSKPQNTCQHHTMISLASVTTTSLPTLVFLLHILSFSCKKVNKNHTCNHNNSLFWHCAGRDCYPEGPMSPYYGHSLPVLTLLKGVSSNLAVIRRMECMTDIFALLAVRPPMFALSLLRVV